LAVDKNFAGRGFGRGLLKDALLRCLNVSEAVGARAVLVHAIDDEACGFYRKFGFLPFPTSSRTLVLPIDTVKVGVLFPA
jgi:GNAT superfamily N-acetyltransferase